MSARVSGARNGQYIPTPPSAGDILIAARAHGWPVLTYRGATIDGGEQAWRQFVERLTEIQRLEFWHWMGSRTR